MSNIGIIPPPLEELLGRKTLIVGEAGRGKTLMLVKIAEELRDRGLVERATIVDMAPIKMRGVGGRMIDYAGWLSSARYLAPLLVYPPRLLGTTSEDVLRYASLNASRITRLLGRYLGDPTPILVVNDLTIYLHAGDESLLERCISLSETFIASAYRGSLLADDKGTGITTRERSLLDSLIERMDRVISIEQEVSRGGPA